MAMSISQNQSKIRRKFQKELYNAEAKKKTKEHFDSLDKSDLVNICLNNQDLIESYERYFRQTDKLLALSGKIINRLKMKLKLKFRESWQN